MKDAPIDRRTRVTGVVCALMSALMSALTSSAPACSCADPGCRETLGSPVGDVDVTATRVTAGLTVPWSLGFLPDGTILVTERGGALRALKETAPGERSLVDLAAVDIDADGEGGLLGLAVDPEFDATRAIFIYATFGGENRIERFLVDADVTSAVRDGVVLAGIPAGARHDGGRLRFGPDGALYASTGETGAPELSRDPASLGGKLLRVDKTGGVDPEILISGIRNSQGFDFLDEHVDDGAGGLYGGRFVIADHGPSGEFGRTGHDELNVAEAGDDLGWPDRYSCEADDVMRAPILTWTFALPPGGVALVRGGDAVPALRGSVLVAALGAEQLERVTLDDAQSEIYFDGAFGRLRDVVESPDGRLFMTTSNCDGRGACPADGDEILELSGR